MLRIEEPFHGAVLNRRHGRIADGALHVTVTGGCPLYGAVTVNGVPARSAGGRFTATVPVSEREADIVAIYQGSYGRLEHTVRVVWDRNSFARYRFSIDDNSFWLRDIAQQGYDSVFDCFYLAILRDLNREYGTKFTLNIYYDVIPEFGQARFQIPDFPDRYRPEFEANADWLGLAFHAYANEPDRPYQYASADKLLSDLQLVEEQIVRFAGERTLITPTVIHWGMVQPDALKALHSRGVRVLSGFDYPSNYGHDVNYWADDAKCEYLTNHDALMDWDSGIVFSYCDIICNNTPVDQVVPALAPLAEDPNTAEIMDLFTHEQYFWPFYRRYLPDHAERLEAAIRWVTDQGYAPVFFHEGFLGAPE